MNQYVSAVILAAGNSSRMNSPKLFLPFDDERNFIEKIIDTYIASGIGNIVLVINENAERRLRLILSMNDRSCNIELVVNRFPEKGRFYSIQLGLRKLNNSLCFIQNIDNPFITKVLLNEMMRAITKKHYVVPVFRNKDGHPVLLSSDIVNHLLLLKGDDHNLRNELKYFEKNIVAWPFEDIRANINTMEDYRKYFLPFEATI